MSICVTLLLFCEELFAYKYLLHTLNLSHTNFMLRFLAMFVVVDVQYFAHVLVRLWSVSLKKIQRIYLKYLIGYLFDTKS